MTKTVSPLLLLFLLASQLAAAQVPTVLEEDAPETEAATEAEPESTEASDEEANSDAPEYENDLDDFVPSEEVPPDEQLTFPVDI